MTQQRTPAVVNKESGTADAAERALGEHGAFDVHAVAPDDIGSTVTALAQGGARRILVAGGDGTIATAASALLGRPVELAVLPGGTLNHFARDLGISLDAASALDLDAQAARGVDIGMVNDQVFLNTSSVGAYVQFVRARERLEQRFGYRLASFLAALRILFQFRRLGVELEVDGETRLYRTPLVFIGVGERELQLPTLGNRVKNGRRGLHVMVVRGNSAARLLAIGLAAVARGVDHVSATPKLDSFIVDRCRIVLRRPTRVAVDGELVTLQPPLEFTLHRDALQVVCPADRDRPDR
ncbi:MAG: diacylglycerol kinase catalytic region [Gemmatimonadetes bacterium]|jgi:diacylglycerol kinase family enzyme|nr:diacylglycerol kinase catalytic region [Gemmatimonadota bacterium]